MLTCEFCGREIKNKQEKLLHEISCKKKGIKGHENIINNPKHDTSYNPQHIHEFILLDPTEPSQKRAIAEGYNIVCKTCKELE